MTVYVVSGSLSLNVISGLHLMGLFGLCVNVHGCGGFSAASFYNEQKFYLRLCKYFHSEGKTLRIYNTKLF